MFPYKQFLMRWRRADRNGREGGAEAELEVRDFNRKAKEERRQCSRQKTDGNRTESKRLSWCLFNASGLIFPQ